MLLLGFASSYGDMRVRSMISHILQYVMFTTMPPPFRSLVCVHLSSHWSLFNLEFIYLCPPFRSLICINLSGHWSVSPFRLLISLYISGHLSVNNSQVIGLCPSFRWLTFVHPSGHLLCVPYLVSVTYDLERTMHAQSVLYCVHRSGHWPILIIQGGNIQVIDQSV